MDKKFNLSTNQSGSSSTAVNRSEKSFPTNSEGGVSIEDKGIATRLSEEPTCSNVSRVSPEYPEGAYAVEDKSITPAQQTEGASSLKGTNLIAPQKPEGAYSLEDENIIPPQQGEGAYALDENIMDPQQPEGAYALEENIMDPQQPEGAYALEENIMDPQQPEGAYALEDENNILPQEPEIDIETESGGDEDEDENTNNNRGYSQAEQNFINRTSRLLSKRKTDKYFVRKTFIEVDKLAKMAKKLTLNINTTVGHIKKKWKRDISLYEKNIVKTSLISNVTNRYIEAASLKSPLKNLYQIIKKKFQWGEVKNHFLPTSDYSTMLSYLWGMEDFHSVGSLSEYQSARKDEQYAKGLFSLAHEFRSNLRYGEALETINKSLTYAEPPDSPKYDKFLPRGYACRAELLLSDLLEPLRSLADINRAFDLNYNEGAMLEFRVRAENEVRVNENIAPHIPEGPYNLQYPGYIPYHFCCTNVLGNSNLDIRRKFPLHFNIRSIEVPRLDHPHPYIPSLTKSANIGYTEKKGRYLYAVEDINPGTVIIREQSFSYSLHEHAVYKYCTFCLKRVADPVPCPRCSKVVFCDGECLAQGQEAFHDFECRILSKLYAIESEDSPYAVLLVRILAKYPFELLKQNFATLRKEEAQRKEEASKHPEETEDLSRLGFNGEFYSSTDYKPIFYLINHKDNPDEKRVLGACRDVLLILKALAEIEFFGTDVNLDENQPLPDEYKELGEILMRHYQAMLVNAHELYDTWSDEYEDLSFSNYGVAISSVYSLLNHSCCPTAYNFNYGSLNIVRAIEYIPKGSEITICYGKPFESMLYSSRQEAYKGLYYFKCSCKACVQVWPMIDEIEDMFFLTRLVCPMCGGNFDSEQCRTCMSTTVEIPTRISGRGHSILTIDDAYSVMVNAITDGCFVAQYGIKMDRDYDEMCRVISTLSLIGRNRQFTYFKRVLIFYFHNIAYHNHRKNVNF